MRKHISTIAWIIAGLAGFFIFLRFYDSAFPQASLKISLSRKDAVNIAKQYLSLQGFNIKGFDKAVLFYGDFEDSVYLQKTQGIKKTNEYIASGIPIWFWQVRFFKELDKEGFYLWIDPTTGKVNRFQYNILEDKAGADISLSDALSIACAYVSAHNIDLSQYEMKENSTLKRKNRTDHFFTWEKKNFSIAEAKYRVSVSVYGDQIGRYIEYLKLPEGFFRMLDKENSFGDVLTMASGTIMFIFTIFAMIVMVRNNKLLSGNLLLIPAVMAVVILSLKLLNAFNEFPVLWNYYPDTVSKPLFVAAKINSIVHNGFIFSAIVFSYCLLALMVADKERSRCMPIIFSGEKISSSRLLSRCFVGYSIAFIFLGYVTVFYIVGGRFLNIWMPPNTLYSNLLATLFPFLFPLTIGFSAAINEEFTYRMFMGKFLENWCGFKMFAVIFPAFIWAMGHASYAIYPAYARVLELTIFGIALAWVFNRYGIETVIVAHFTINATLGALPLLRSNNPLFFAYGLLASGFILLPVFFVKFFHRRA